MMHNGGVENFSAIKRQIREPLNDEFYNWIKGQTDSEHIFALLFIIFSKNLPSLRLKLLFMPLKKLLAHLNKLMTAAWNP